MSTREEARRQPLVITAEVKSGVVMPRCAIPIDSLLAWAAIQKQNASAKAVKPCIPVAKEKGERFHLASFSVGYVVRADEVMASVVRITERGEETRSAQVRLRHFRGGKLLWYALGDADQIADLLSLVLYIGTRCVEGYGLVSKWRVEPCAPWPGFPVMHDGQPLRPLPLDWPGLSSRVARGRSMLTMPYRGRNYSGEIECAMPREMAT